MTAQVLSQSMISNELMVVLKGLTIDQSRQVLNFAKFLAHQGEAPSLESSEQPNGIVSISKSWVEEASGSMKDIPEFDAVVAYGSAIRQGDYSGLLPMEEG